MALVKESIEKGTVSFSEGRVFERFNEIKQYMYSEVYSGINTDVHPWHILCYNSRNSKKTICLL